MFTPSTGIPPASAVSTERSRVPSPPRLTSRSAPSAEAEPSDRRAGTAWWPCPDSHAAARSARAVASGRSGLV